MGDEKKNSRIEELTRNNSLQLTALLEVLEERGLLRRDEVFERMRVLQDQEEPRLAGRRSALKAAQIEVVSLQDGSKRQAQGVNLSAGGLLVATPDTLKEGSPVLLRFWEPEGLQPIEPRGVVVRSVPGKEMAIRFVELSPQASQAITRCLVTPALETADSD